MSRCLPKTAQKIAAPTPTSKLALMEKEREKDNFDEVADIARSAFRIARSIKETINTEVKRYSVIYSNPQLDYANPTITVINNPAQGLADNQRSGDSIKCLDLSFRLSMYVASATTPNALCRVIVFWDESNIITGTGTAVATTYELLENQGTLDGTIALLAPKDYDNRFLTKILFDHTYSLNVWNNWQDPVIDKTIRLHKHAQFDAGSTNIVTGALKVAFISNSYNPPANTAGVVVKAWFNMSFTDD